MGVRSCAKAIVVRGDRMLLNRCRDDKNGVYHVLPGGGQNPDETLEEAVARECLEETGYRVTPERFAALHEEIIDDEDFQARFPGYAHRVYHVFVCRLSGEGPGTPTEIDAMQTGCEWVEMSALGDIRLLPEAIGENIREILEARAPMYLGSRHICWNHG
jgi:ADP-ribose pyrophosphatase YjhB (NUDIX family)